MSGKKSFIIALLTITSLMFVSYGLTIVLDCEGIGFFTFLLSPVLNLMSDNGSTTLAIVIFLVILGGITFNLNDCGFMEYMLNKLAYKYSDKRYIFVAVLIFIFMAMGSLIGSFEEVVPLVPLCVVLAKSFGFDDYTGISMSLLAVGCGFAAGVANPFTIGVAQQLANLPMFSGAGYRVIAFILIYILVTFFVLKHAKKIAVNVNNENKEFEENKVLDSAIKYFVVIMLIGLAVVVASPFLTFLQDYTMIIIALMFLIAGVVSCKVSKVSTMKFLKNFLKGIVDMIPSIILIMFASSIRFIMEESGCITILINLAINFASSLSNIQLIIFMYLLCLIIELFISSGSAKAFIIIPMLMPIAIARGINPQIVIMAYAFGDGFSNVFYPTNAGLLISLGLINMSYKDWLKHSFKFQLCNLALTMVLLIIFNNI